MWKPVCLAVVALSLVLGGDSSAAAPESMTRLNPQELIRFFDFGDDAVKRMEKGEIISVSKADLEGSKKGLAMGLAMIIPHGVEDCTEVFAGPEMFSLDPAVLDFARITIEDPQGSFSSVKFSAQESRESKSLISAKMGSEFNLANTDLERIRSAGNADGGMRDVLSARFRNYVAKGLAGIEPYQRSAKSSASPAEELLVALDHSPLLEARLPKLHAYLRTFPASKPEGVENRYYWVKRTVAGRPAFSLLHWTMLVEPQFAFLSEREVYVGHTYNSMQVFFAVLPFNDGVIVFYLNRTFTDQVAGFASGLAHKIGRGRLTSAITANFENMRAGFAK